MRPVEAGNLTAGQVLYNQDRDMFDTVVAVDWLPDMTRQDLMALTTFHTQTVVRFSDVVLVVGE